MWASWTAWAIGAVVLAILEVVVPGYVFLGFAIGAGLTALLLLFGGPLSVWITGSFALALLFFAVMSLISWLALRRVLRSRSQSPKIFEHDINDD